MIDIFVFLFGIAFGSFLNVCIHRVPREESVVKPGSHCPHCLKPIAWYDNIPLLSFLWLRAKCRHCGKKIALRYFVVELLSGGIWLWMWHTYATTWFFAAAVIYLSILLAITMTDIEEGLIPDFFTFPGMAAGVILSALQPQIQGESLWLEGLKRSLLGLAFGYALMWSTGFLGNLVFKKESMGGGDIKLLAMMGSFLGIAKVALVFFAAPFFALPVSLYLWVTKKSGTIPYGPYLALSGALLFFYGDRLLKILFF